MRIVASTGEESFATVYVVEFENGKLAECVEAVQPPLPREKKWVLLVSTMFGCPVACMMCDAGGFFQGKMSYEEIIRQIDYLVLKRFPDGKIPSDTFKIQFARMGEPTLNAHVLEVLNQLPERYQAPGLMPSLSTIAPKGSEHFLSRLLEIKQNQYHGGRFQFQFSIHTTDEIMRDKIIPVKKWDFLHIADYGNQFFKEGDRKITLNFALIRGMPVDANVLLKYFNPQVFLIKITPLNPTYRGTENGLSSQIVPEQNSDDDRIIKSLQEAGYQVIVSIGEWEENLIGSNCGQYVLRHLKSSESIQHGYTYPVIEYH